MNDKDSNFNKIKLLSRICSYIFDQHFDKNLSNTENLSIILSSLQFMVSSAINSHISDEPARQDCFDLFIEQCAVHFMKNIKNDFNHDR